MKYERIETGTFLERPNRFIAYVELHGKQETVHVKNTGRCAELLKEGVKVYVQENESEKRRTKWDLIAVQKERRLINMDSQIPNKIVKEWIEAGGMFEDVTLIQTEKTYKNSRFDLYVETGKRKIFIEVKGVTLEENGVCRFPDAPSERAVKHVRELCEAKKEGYEAYIFFVVQMQGVRYFTPNIDTHPAFAETLKEAVQKGVHIVAYDCTVGTDCIEIRQKVPVILECPRLKETAAPLVSWYRRNKRNLPWREQADAYRVWVSEIMLQQTRVESVKPYYERFLKALPNVKELAEAEEEKLLKLWEGLGYYNRIRNMQIAAQQIVEKYDGEFPRDFEEIAALKGIGSYTAGAISSFAYGIPKPAVDGNVLRVVSRILANEEDIMKAGVRKKIEQIVEEVIPEDAASDFNQGLIELGALICVPGKEPKCTVCPVKEWCLAFEQGKQDLLPIRQKAKGRKIEKRTIFLFRDMDAVAIRKRPEKGLLAGLYEFPNVEGHLSRKEAIAYSQSVGLSPIRVKKLQDAKHIFSHVEWHMRGYEILVDELEKNCSPNMIFAKRKEIDARYPIPSAFEVYRCALEG
ncbi:DNA/RNA nuclease SfsA [Ruminococcus sp. AF18-22]|nr:DNA/RNA nuclease SfsA [Ruminococcus sp. AF18-22]